MRYDADHKGQTRAKVLKVASRALRAEGPERLSVAQVMSRAGLTHGGFYAHFASKNDLIARAVEASFDEALGLVASLSEGRTPQATLLAYVDFYLSDTHRAARHAGCPVAALSTDVPRLPAEAQNAFAAGVERLLAGLGGMLTRAGRDPALAQPLLTQMVGAVALARAVDEESARALLDQTRGDILRRLDLETRT